MGKKLNRLPLLEESNKVSKFNEALTVNTDIVRVYRHKAYVYCDIFFAEDTDSGKYYEGYDRIGSGTRYFVQFQEIDREYFNVNRGEEVDIKGSQNEELKEALTNDDIGVIETEFHIDANVIINRFFWDELDDNTDAKIKAYNRYFNLKDINDVNIGYDESYSNIFLDWINNVLDFSPDIRKKSLNTVLSIPGLSLNVIERNMGDENIIHYFLSRNPSDTSWESIPKAHIDLLKPIIAAGASVDKFMKSAESFWRDVRSDSPVFDNKFIEYFANTIKVNAEDLKDKIKNL